VNEAARAFEEAVHSSHRGTRIAAWFVALSIACLVFLVMR
jgi:hypothetical protein